VKFNGLYSADFKNWLRFDEVTVMSPELR